MRPCVVMSVSLLTLPRTNGVVITPAIMRIPISEYHICYILQMSDWHSETLRDNTTSLKKYKIVVQNYNRQSIGANQFVAGIAGRINKTSSFI